MMTIRDQIIGYLILMLALSPVTNAWAIDYPYGDLNQDKVINAVDSNILADVVLKRNTTASAVQNGDFNQDGVCDVADVIYLKNYDGDWDHDGLPDASEPDYAFDPEISGDNDNNVNKIPDDLELDENSDAYAEIVDPYRVDENAILSGGSSGDSDGDGLTNSDEETGYEWTYPVNLGGKTKPISTDSLSSDTDRDGMTDAAEWQYTDPTNPDTDGDGVLDGYDSAPLDPAVTETIALMVEKESGSKINPRLTPAQMEANKKWQESQFEAYATYEKKIDKLNAEEALSATVEPGGTSGRGLGFQGPAEVGSNFESIQSDQFTGAFSYSIPIKVPPGRNGMEPNLSLVYRSTNGHSGLGQGWDLNPGRIERSTKDGMPKYTDATYPPASDNDPFTPLDNPDTFVYTTSAGSSQLVYTGTDTVNGQTCGIYHAVVDSGNFIRFIHHPDAVNPGKGWWESWSKDGHKTIFGKYQLPCCGSTQMHPEKGVFIWRIESTEDINGNKILFEYMYWGTNMMYLDEIRYNLDGDIPKAYIKFEYTGSDDADTIDWASSRESYRYGVKEIDNHFLTSITETVIGRSPYFGNSNRVRKYILAYKGLYRFQGQTISCLKSVQEFGETDAVSFPAVTMEYSLHNHQWEYHNNDGNSYLLPYPLRNRDNGLDYGSRFGDFNGDGLVDVIWAYRVDDGQLEKRYVALNNGNGWDFDNTGNSIYALPITFRFITNFTNKRIMDWGGIVDDINGDGLTDIAQNYWYFINETTFGEAKIAFNTSAGWRYYPEPYWNVGLGHPYQIPVFLVWTGIDTIQNKLCNVDYGARSGDINGDGLVDIIWGSICKSDCNEPHYLHIQDDMKFVSLNTGKGWRNDFSGSFPYAPFCYFSQRFLSDTSNRYSYSFGGNIVDLNGDGLNDIAWAYKGDSEDRFGLSINTGDTWFNELVNVIDYRSQPYQIPAVLNAVSKDPHNGFDVANVEYGGRFADFNGDGLVDIIWSNSCGTSTFFKCALNFGNGWGPDIGDTTYQPPQVFTEITPNQDGIEDYNIDQGSAVVDINGDGLPDLIWASENSSGTFDIKSLAFNRGGIPNLLTKINNGMGGKVEVEYTPQTKAWMKLYDPETGPETNDHYPGVIQTVTKITQTGMRPNNINPANPITGGATEESYTTLYRYSGAQLLDREFRGFGKVKEIDAQTGNFTITEFYQDFARKGQIKSIRSYVADRRDYREGGAISGPLKTAAQEAAPTHEPKMVSQSHIRYRVVIHDDDDNHLKTFTDTSAKLGIADFPKGMTLVTPACVVTKTYEYGGSFGGSPSVMATAKETFYDGRGNLMETLDFGQVNLAASDLDEPRADITFQNDVGAEADGRVSVMSEFALDFEPGGTLIDWMDVPIMVNTAGYYTNDLTTGARETSAIKLLESKTISYDSLKRPSQVTRSLDTGPDPTTSFAYDAFGNVIQITDPLGGQTSIGYGIYSIFPGVIINARGHRDDYAVDPGTGNLLFHYAPNGWARSATYDGLGRITQMQDSIGYVTTNYEYAFFGSSGGVYFPTRIKTISHTPTGDTWSEDHYDGLGRKYQTLSLGQRGSEDPIRTVTYFNDRGMAWKTSHPHYMWEDAHWIYTFMENDDTTLPTGSKIWTQMGLNRHMLTWTELNSAGDMQLLLTGSIYETPLSIKTYNNLAQQHREVKDAFGNLIKVWEPDATSGSVGTYLVPQGNMTRYGYNALGNLECVRRHLVNDDMETADPVTKIFYDTLNRKTCLDDPDRGVSLYQYDQNGNLIRSKDARGIEIVRQYDVINRVTRVSYPDVSGSTVKEDVYTYDSGDGNLLIGRLAKIASPNVATDYSYDAEGRTVRTRKTIDGATYEISAEYDAAGRVLSQVYPAGMRLQYGYDAITQALDTIVDPDLPIIYLSNIQSNQFGLINGYTLSDSFSRTNSFDYAGRITRRKTDMRTTTISDLAYTYDSISNIKNIQETAGPTPRGNMNYSYDKLNQLTSAYGVTMSGADAGDDVSSKYTYFSNCLGQMRLNSRFKNPSYSDYTLYYDYSADPSSDRPANGLRSIQFTKYGPTQTVYAHHFYYDAAGNLTSSTNEEAALPENDLARTYQWDAFGRLAQVSKGSQTTRFVYGPDNERIKKIGPSGQTVTYVGDLIEITSEGMTKHIFAGPRRIATIQPNLATLFYMLDHQDSSVLITEGGGPSAHIVQRMDYEPYGDMMENARSSNTKGLRHTYTGQEDDPETGLMYYRARYYDPVVGMFVSPDTLVPEADNPQAFNRYAYVYNNPIGYMDPTGNWGFKSVFKPPSPKAIFGGAKKLIGGGFKKITGIGRKEGGSGSVGNPTKEGGSGSVGNPTIAQGGSGSVGNPTSTSAAMSLNPKSIYNEVKDEGEKILGDAGDAAEEAGTAVYEGGKELYEGGKTIYKGGSGSLGNPTRFIFGGGSGSVGNPTGLFKTVFGGGSGSVGNPGNLWNVFDPQQGGSGSVGNPTGLFKTVFGGGSGSVGNPGNLWDLFKPSQGGSGTVGNPPDPGGGGNE